MDQQLILCTSTARGMGSIPGRGTKIPHVMQCSQEKKKSFIIIEKGIFIFWKQSTFLTVKIGFIIKLTTFY